MTTCENWFDCRAGAYVVIADSPDVDLDYPSRLCVDCYDDLLAEWGSERVTVDEDRTRTLTAQNDDQQTRLGDVERWSA